MKVQKRFLRKHKDKDYYKYIVNIPQMVLKESGLKYGEELEILPKKGKIVLKKKSKKEKYTPLGNSKE
jgi:bifunctional DNA-binding transcriptional regulator/antitoxin component of YhaV-PrlF toxin-antitoxin module